jgi:chromosome segregation protein
VLHALDVEPGSERAVAAALGQRASAVLTDDAGSGLDLLRRACSAGLGSLTVVAGREPAELVSRLPVVAVDELLDATVPSVTVEGFGYDPAAGELWFAGETAEAVLLQMDARRRALADEADELAARASASEVAAEAAAQEARAAEAAFAEVAHLRGRVIDATLLERIAAAATALTTDVARSEELTRVLEEPLAARTELGRARAAEIGAELRRLSMLEADAARDATGAVERAQAAEMVVIRLGGSIDGVHVDAGADRDALARESSTLLAASDAAAAAAREAADRARAADFALVERSPRRSRLDPDLLRRLCSAADDLDAGLEAACGLAVRLESPVRARVDAGAERTTRLGDELRRLGAAEVELRRGAEEAAERATQVQIELARLEAESDEAQRRLEAAGPVEPAEGDDRVELATRAERLESRRESLGRVNPLAQEEYEEEKVRLEELSVQRQDLEDSLAELEKLRDELTETVERRFADTFTAVAANFEDVAATLFPGGDGRLRLVEGDEDGGEPGVEVELRPAGKRITRLSLLSGGEKALGAISFLFALFLAKPCPFYLLDEVEAALDDANITRFVDLLRRYADQAQFVVITHQKRTMEAADVLYGVTMGADGVSQVVSRRLPQHDRQPAVASA